MRSYLRPTLFLTTRLLLGAGTVAALGAMAAIPHTKTAPLWPLEARCPAPLPTAVGGTLLDEVGRLAGPAPAGDVVAWKRELHAGRPADGRAAWLHLWLGEVELGQNEAPERAVWHFRAAQRLCGAPKNIARRSRNQIRESVLLPRSVG